MDKVQILLYAIASFFTTENPPILVKSAEIEINLITKQIVLHQYDIITIPQYSEKAGSALEELMNARTFVSDLEPLVLTSKYFYEKDGKLNATIYFQFKEMHDLRAISMYFEEEKNILSYPFMDEFEYYAPDAVFDERYIRFKTNGAIDFRMVMKERPELENTVSLLPDWKKIKADMFVDISETFSKKDFIKLRQFIFKNGDFKTFRNFDNNNPHYRFEDFDVYLATGDQRSVFEKEALKPKEYVELIIQDKGYYTLYLVANKKMKSNSTLGNLEKDKVYWHNSSNLNSELISNYLKTLMSTIDRK